LQLRAESASAAATSALALTRRACRKLPKLTTLRPGIVLLSTMASSHFYEGYRSNVSANRSGERSNFIGANVAAKKLSNPSSAAAMANGACAFLNLSRSLQER
jgi:hypothetical protein